MPQFIGREIRVTTGGEVKVPAAFTLDGREYAIVAIVRAWQDYGFGPGAVGRRVKWWQRRHRNYYVVKTADGEQFEIYHDRGTSLKHPERRQWFLTKKL